MNIFSEEYILKSKLLNLFGIQSLRYVLAKIIYTFRGIIFSWHISQETRILEKEGLILIENFLNQDEYNEFKLNFDNLLKIGDDETFQSGDLLVQRSSINTNVGNKLLDFFLKSKKLVKILSAVEKRNFVDYDVSKISSFVWIEKLIIKNSSDHDKQKDLHSDIFFNTHKIWYYPDKVSLEHGPFAYVKQSHKFNFQRIFLEYFNSISSKKIVNIRADNFDLRDYEKNKVITTVNSNTLIIANTHGYHCRTSGKVGNIRKQLHFSVRNNPFEGIFKK